MTRLLVQSSKISELSSEFSERVKGLLGHMLVFAGKGANIAIKFTYSFIRWVFELVLSKLNQAVKAALKNDLLILINPPLLRCGLFLNTKSFVLG